MFCHSSIERGSWRWWLHYGANSSIHVEVSWFRSFCHAELSISDEHWTFALAIPGLAIWLALPRIEALTPKRKCIATWDGGREFWLTDEREMGIGIHDWTIYIKPYCRSGEWRSADPWWIRGVSLNIPDLILGRSKYSGTTGESRRILVPMAEANYPGTATVKHCVWKRPRWFAKKRTYTEVAMDECIPFPGKGENSWDCGMDGLCGYSVSGTSVEMAIAHGVQSALESRRKYGGSVEWRPPVAETA